MDLQKAAKRMLADYDAHKPGQLFIEPELNLDVRDAYDLQLEVARLRESRGERVAGYKIGCISHTMQLQLGINRPVYGRVWESEIHSSGVELDPDQYDRLGIEGEFAVRLLDDVPTAGWLADNPEVISDYEVVIELHNYIFRGPDSCRAAELIGNNAIHAGVVVAEPAAARRTAGPEDDLALPPVLKVERNRKTMGKGVAEHLQGGPAGLIASLAFHLSRHDIQLERNQIVLMGSPLPLWRATPGDRIAARCEGMAEVQCSIAERS